MANLRGLKGLKVREIRKFAQRGHSLNSGFRSESIQNEEDTNKKKLD
jgi:hypothetical protein